MKDSVKYGFLSLVGGMFASCLMLTVMLPTVAPAEPPKFISQDMFSHAEKYCTEKGYTKLYHEYNSEGLMTFVACATLANNGQYVAEEVDWRDMN